MNDRFKFRYVFQKKLENKQTLIQVRYFDIEDIEHPNFMDGINEITRKGYELVARNLCTGLKDKNGKLIFEGDIVYKKANKYCGEKELSTVDFCNMYAQFNISDRNGLHKMPSNPLNIEVIGNLYEHAELLKGGEE